MASCGDTYDECDVDYDDELDDYETMLAECGYVPGHGCMLAGTEYCDWECRIGEELEADNLEIEEPA
jgi:hypothetical protein